MERKLASTIQLTACDALKLLSDVTILEELQLLLAVTPV